MLGLVSGKIINLKLHVFTRAWFITRQKGENLDGAAVS